MGCPDRGNDSRSDTLYTRRNFLKYGLLTTIAGIPPGVSHATMFHPEPYEKNLSLFNVHTDEQASVVYWRKGHYLSDSLKEIDYILRDYRTDEIKVINTQLLDLLYNIHSRLNTRQSFHIVSGYRSPKTNEYLYNTSAGVSKNSLHMFGMAVDVRIPLCDIHAIAEVATSMRAGGVGLYPDSNFIHIDIGEVRTW